MSPSYHDIFYSVEEKPLGPYPRRLAAYIMDRVDAEPGDRVFEMGVGRGEYLNGFHELGMDVMGVDLNPETARKYFPMIGSTVTQGDLDHLFVGEFEKDSFDLVFSKSVIEHVHNPLLMLANARDLLRPGGHAVIMVPKYDPVWFWEDWTHKRPFVADTLRRLMAQAGFKNIAVEEFRQLPILWEWPILKPLSILTGWLCPYAIRRKWKWTWFSKEIMLLGIGGK